MALGGLGSIKATIAGTAYTLTKNPTTGMYEATITAPTTSSYLQPNKYFPVTITATDLAGNTTTKNDTDTTLGPYLKLGVIEKTPPVITITAPSGGAYSGNSTPFITFSIVDTESGVAPSTITLKIDGGTAIGVGSAGMVGTAITNGYSYTYTPQAALSDGAHTITIDAKDNDGNSAVQVSSTFTVDTVPPSLNVSSPASSGVWSASKSYTVTGTVADTTSGAVSVKLVVGGTVQKTLTNQSGSFTETVTLVEGANTLDVIATDKAGKETTVTRTINVDTVAPVISAVNITPNPISVGGAIKISVQITD